MRDIVMMCGDIARTCHFIDEDENISVALQSLKSAQQLIN